MSFSFSVPSPCLVRASPRSLSLSLSLASSRLPRLRRSICFDLFVPSRLFLRASPGFRSLVRAAHYCTTHEERPAAPENRGNPRVTVMRVFCNCVKRRTARPRHDIEGGVGRGGSFSTADSRGPRKTIPRVRVKTKSRRVGFERFLLDALTNKPCTRISVLRRGIWQFRRAREPTVFDDGISKAV